MYLSLPITVFNLSPGMSRHYRRNILCFVPILSVTSSSKGVVNKMFPSTFNADFNQIFSTSRYEYHPMGIFDFF
jgi:hypothetical protein